MKHRFNHNVWILPLLLAAVLVACGGGRTYTPRPRGYINIYTPDPAYQKYDSLCPFTFEYSKYALMKPYSRGDEKRPCWFDLHYPEFGATIHASYDEVNKNLKSYIDDSHTLVYKHVVKSSGIEESLVIDTATRVFGTVYNIEGDPASPYQFYLTDSTRHFFRAALYFDFKPNYDSLAPVLTFLKADMDHIVETFEWKKVGKRR